MNNILVTGSNGQLGSEIRVLEKDYQHYNFFFTDVNQLDITIKEAIEEFVNKNKINIIINCAAYTAVDKAESEFELANEINHIAVKYIAELAKLYSCKFIHVSTDYVFDGEAYEPYVEDDITNPQSVYGRTKLDGELTLQRIAPENSIIIRTSWVYSNFGNNFVKTILRLGNDREVLNVIQDQVGTPTNAADLANIILEILPKIRNKEVEFYHFSNEGVCSWYDFAKAIFEIRSIDCKVKPIATKIYPTPAKRPSYSVLSKLKIKETYNIEIPYWRDSLKVMLLNE
jgi:dTDP-4-dehydrorhamnose reductase